MKELEEILRALPRLDAPAVLATLVSVQGSTYRRPGARMLVQNGRRLLGTISGGCLEADVCRQSEPLTPADAPRVVEFDTLDDDDMLLGYSMGCKGVVRILLQPIAANRALPAPLDRVARCLELGQSAALATVYGGPSCGSQVVLHDDEITGDIPADHLRDDLRHVLSTGRWLNRMHAFSTGPADVFIEPIVPTVRLMIFGGGHDAPPLAQVADVLGWRVSVIDPRPANSVRPRFPTADEIVELPPSTAARELTFNARTAAVVMTHNYAHDLDLLAGLLPRGLPYVGLLGPRHRTDRLMSDLAARGIDLKREQLHVLYTPAGLDIGTNHPEEIALAIVAEIQAVLSRRPGNHLRDRAGDIHDPLR